MARQIVVNARRNASRFDASRSTPCATAFARERDDLVVVEEPLEIRLARLGETGPGTPVSVTMRTPGHDVELALGFLHGEGLIRSSRDVASVRECGADGNVVRVELPATCRWHLARLQRNFYTTSSCGVCGKASLEAVAAMFGIAKPVERRACVARAADARSADGVALGTTGLPRHRRPACRVPVRRKWRADRRTSRTSVATMRSTSSWVARLLADALPLSGSVLLLSGRASFELLQKAAAGRRAGRRCRSAHPRASRSTSRAHGHPAGRLPARRFVQRVCARGAAAMNGR